MSTPILDDLKYLHQKDSGDALGFAGKQFFQLNDAFSLQAPSKPPENIVFAAMGGSSLSGLFALNWPGCDVPFEIWRRYGGPNYLSSNTLVIIGSYSGNTEESLASLRAALDARASIVVIAGGGTLIERAKQHRLPYILLPSTPHPRFGWFAAFTALLTVLEAYDVSNAKQPPGALKAASKFLESEVKNWAPDKAAKENPAKQLALELAGTTPIIYAGQTMFPAAQKWKLAFNENAKNLAWCNEIPEFCHNEFTGWTSHPVEKAFSVIDLCSSLDQPQIKKRFELSEQLLSGKRPHPHRVEAKGSTVLEQLLYLSMLGDFVSLYVAMLNGVDPTPLPCVDKLKAGLVT